MLYAYACSKFKDRHQLTRHTIETALLAAFFLAPSVATAASECAQINPDARKVCERAKLDFTAWWGAPDPQEQRATGATADEAMGKVLALWNPIYPDPPISLAGSCAPFRNNGVNTFIPVPWVRSIASSCPLQRQGSPLSGTAYGAATCPPNWKVEWPLNAQGQETTGEAPWCVPPTSADPDEGRCTMSMGNPVYIGNGTKTQPEQDFEGALPLKRLYSSGPSRLTSDVGRNWASNYFGRLVHYPEHGLAVIERSIDERRTFVFRNGSWRPLDRTSARLTVDTSSGQGGWLMTRTSPSASVERYDQSGLLKQIRYAAGGGVDLAYSDGTTGEYVDESGSSTGKRLAPGLLTSVSDAQGRRISFSYLESGAIAQVTDPSAGLTKYRYTDGLLSKVIHPDASSRSYVYGESTLTGGVNLGEVLTGIQDESGARYATFSYDGATGKALSTEHFGGTQKYAFSYLNDTVLVTDPIGAKRTFTIGTFAGTHRLLSVDQPAGSGCNSAVKTSAYDIKGNVIAQDDFTGRRTCFAYDLSRSLEITRVEGLPQGAACGNYLAPGATLPEGARKTTTQWHPDWNFPIAIFEPGRVTNFGYNGQPDLAGNGAMLACAPQTSDLLDSKPIAALCKKTERATTDGNGSKGATPVVSTGDSNFNSVNLLLHMDGANGGTSFIDSSVFALSPRSAMGATLSTTAPKFGNASLKLGGTGSLKYAESANWNLSGNWTIELWFNLAPGSTAGRYPHLWQIGYDLNNRANMFVQGGVLTFFSQTGSITKSMPIGSISEGVWYHVAASKTGDTVNLYLNGNPAGSVDAVLQNTSGNSLTIGAQSFYPQAKDYFIGHIDDFRMTNGVSRYSSSFTPASAAFPDLLGDPPGGPTLDATVPQRTWTYTYNEFGQILTSRDPRGNTTTNAYYATTTADYTRGDLEKTTNALNQTTRFTKYNPMGQVLQSIDANNVVTDYEYDLRGRLKTQTTAGQSTTYEYVPTGLLKRVTQPDASYVSYEYDPAQRLVAVADNLGNRIEYTLDNSGHQREERVKDPAGVLKRQVSRVFDALGRTQQVTGRE